MKHIFYHAADQDGICAAAIVLEKHKDAVLHPINYHDDADEVVFPNISKNDTVIMVDFSLKPFKNMIKLHKMCDQFFWIDHHSSAIKESIECNFRTEGVTIDGVAGCVLSWLYFFPEKNIPIGVDLIGKYDVWDIDDEKVKQFHHGMDAIYKSPTDSIWKKIFQNDKKTIDNILYDGKIIEDYIKKSNIKTALSDGITISVGDYTTFLINDYVDLDYLIEADIYKKDVHDFLMMFRKIRHGWKFSLRSASDEIDVSSICKAFKGGGHKKAAGFTINDEYFIGKLVKGRTLIKKT